VRSAARSELDDPAGFAEVVRDHQREVWRYLRFLGAGEAEADDLCQDTFLRVVDRRLNRFGAGGARAYLRRVARNLLIKLRARSGSLPTAPEFDVNEAAFEWYRGDDDGESTRAALRACLAELSDSRRHALELRFRDDLDRSEIAVRLGLSTHGVKSLLQRTYARLRACVERRTRDA
jgi:RNA polymerase sigma-70 factor (ECF subfamily)